MIFTNKVYLVHGAIAVQWWPSVCLLVGRCFSHCTMCPARIVTAGYYIPPRNGGTEVASKHQQKALHTPAGFKPGIPSLVSYSTSQGIAIHNKKILSRLL